MRAVVAVILSLSLCGCAVVAIPPAVTIASYAVDGISYVATGKSVSDHALSGIAGQDCALVRAVVLENPCRDWVPPDSDHAVAVETAFGGAEVSAQIAEADLAAGSAGPVLSAERRARANRKPAVAEASRIQPQDRYLVVGSFRARANAERVRRAKAGLGAEIMPVSVRGKRFYRVVTPAGRDAVGWAIAACDAGRRADNCIGPQEASILRARAAGEGDRGG